MSSMRKRFIVLVTVALTVVAVLGSSLGVVMAGTRQPLSVGFNLAGGPLNADIQPADYVGCLPAGSWTALYIWDAENQTWKHYFNLNGGALPAYINGSNVGGIGTIPRLSGVVLIMAQAVPAPRLKDQASESCG